MELALFDYMENTGAHTYLRVGGSGGIGTDVHPGDVVISSGVVRAEGMTKAYIPAEFDTLQIDPPRRSNRADSVTTAADSRSPFSTPARLYPWPLNTFSNRQSPLKSPSPP